MRRKTPDEMLKEFYQREGDRRHFERNDEAAFERLKQEQEYKDIRLQVLRDLGVRI